MAQVWNTARLNHIGDMNFNYKLDRWISRTSIRSLIGKCVYYISLKVSSVTCEQILEINLYTKSCSLLIGGIGLNHNWCIGINTRDFSGQSRIKAESGIKGSENCNCK